MLTVGGSAGVTLTITNCDTPEQVSVKVVAALNPVRVSLPAVSLVPDHVPPEAVHEVALVLLHVKVVLPPLGTLAGLALIVTVATGVGGGSTVMVTSATALLPPGPMQKMLNFAVACNEPVPCDPDTPRPAPDHAPPAVHEVAPVLVQFKVVEPLYASDV